MYHCPVHKENYVRISHFVSNQPRSCTFCSLNGINPVPDETFSHIVLYCDTVRNRHNRFLADYLPIGYLRDEQDRKNLFFLGRVLESESDNYFIAMTVLIFQYVVWEQKLRKKIPSYQSINLEFREHIRNLLRGNARARRESTKTNFILCRILRHGAVRGLGDQ